MKTGLPSAVSLAHVVDDRPKQLLFLQRTEVDLFRFRYACCLQNSFEHRLIRFIAPR